MLYRRQVEFGSTNTSRHLEHFRTSWIIYSGHDLGILWLETHLLLMARLAPPGQHLNVHSLQQIFNSGRVRKIEGQHLVNVISFAQPNLS